MPHRNASPFRHQTASSLALAFVFAAAFTGPLAAPAHAQSDADLRRQNQELSARVRDLQAELDAARKQNENLQRRIAALEAQLANRSGGGASGGGAAPLPEEEITIDETKPGASPRSMFNTLAESYKQAVGESPMGEEGDRDRVAYLRKLEKWAAASEREYRTPIEWHVRWLEPRVLDAGREPRATFVAVDPVTDVRLGDPFEVVLPRVLGQRLAEMDRRVAERPMVLKGFMVPAIRINPERPTRGSFDNPRFLGPFAEYDFAIDPSSLMPVKPNATQPTTNVQPAATQPTSPDANK